jgi:phosphate transport system substrate-binding protein
MKEQGENMKQILIALIMLGLIFAGGCKKADNGKVGPQGKSQTKETITMSGAWALYPLAVKWADVYDENHPVTFDASGGGAGKGMADALSGMVDIGLVSREVQQAETDKGAFAIAVTKDAVVPVINAENPLIKEIMKKGIKKEAFEKIWTTGEGLNWQDVVADAGAGKTEMNIYTRSDSCGAAETWAKYLGHKQEDLKGTGISSDPSIAEAVRNDLNGIGYNNVNYAYDGGTRKPLAGLVIVPIDLNGDGSISADEDFYGSRDALQKAIIEGKYPSPPARNLYFVTKGNPQRQAVKDFIKWTLTDGQKYVDEAGYVKLSDETLKEQVNKLEGK